jgi:hypothetical protein
MIRKQSHTADLEKNLGLTRRSNQSKHSLKPQFNLKKASIKFYEVWER